MGIFDFFKKSENIEKKPQNEISDVEIKGKVLTYDEFGRMVEIEKAEWLKEILYPNIEASWDDAELLCDVVLDAFSKKVYKEVKDACLRIYSIDTNTERKTNILGVYYIKTANYNEAMELYERYLVSTKPTESIYLNYAKVLEYLNKKEEAETNYLRALKINPNSETGLNNYFKILKSKNREEYFHNLIELSKIEGAWRSKLRLASEYFKSGDKVSGNEYLVKALRESNYATEVMALASGIYGMNGFYDEFEKNILPAFNPEKHGAYTTLNILEYHKIKRNYVKGLELCKFSSKFNWNKFIENFKNYEEIFLKMKQEVESLGNIKEEDIKIFATQKPLWYEELRKPIFLLNAEKKKDKNVLILPFISIESEKEFRDKGSLEIATALPLAINDILYTSTKVNNQLVLQHIGTEVIIPEEKYSKEYINQIKEQNPQLHYVISGNIITDYETILNDKQELIEKPIYEIEIYIYDIINDRKYDLVNNKYEKSEIFKIKEKMILNLRNIIDVNMSKITFEKTSENILYYAKKIKLLLEKDENKIYKSWKYKELLNNQLNITLRDLSNDDKKIELISLMYEISKYNSQLLKNIKVEIYNMLNHKQFYSEKMKLIIPIIFNVYSDELNYNKYIEDLSIEVEENVEYVDWLNKFLEYVD